MKGWSVFFSEKFSLSFKMIMIAVLSQLRGSIVRALTTSGCARIKSQNNKIC